MCVPAYGEAGLRQKLTNHLDFVGLFVLGGTFYAPRVARHLTESAAKKYDTGCGAFGRPSGGHFSRAAQRDTKEIFIGCLGISFSPFAGKGETQEGVGTWRAPRESISDFAIGHRFRRRTSWRLRFLEYRFGVLSEMHISDNTPFFCGKSYASSSQTFSGKHSAASHIFAEVVGV